MKKIFIPILVLLITTGNLFAQSNKDDKYFSDAEMALSKKDCDGALRNLQQISIDGKDKPQYLKLMAEMHECKGNKDQAVLFYHKYLDTHPANTDTAQLHINYLQTAIEKSGSSKYLNSGAKALNRKFYAYDLAFSVITGGKTGANFNNAWRISVMRGRPIIKKHAVLEWVLQGGLATNANSAWYATALDIGSGGSIKIGSGLILGANMGISPVWVNNKKYAVIAGPNVGYISTIALGWNYNAYGPRYNDGNMSWGFLTYGLKGRFIYHHTLTAFVGYERLMRDHLDVVTLDITGSEKVINKAKINMSLISIGIGLLF